MKLSSSFLTLGIFFLSLNILMGCTHAEKEPDDTTQFETDQQVQTQQQDVTPTKNEPAIDPATVAPAKNSLPDSSYFNTNETATEGNPIPTTTDAAPSTTSDTATAQPQEEEENSPQVPATKERIHPNPVAKAKELKKTIKFKMPKKSTAQILLVEEPKSVKVSFNATNVKSGKYMLFMEKNCKKPTKPKPIKVAQFIVKKGDKFSGKAQTKVLSLKAGNSKSLKGKALVLYHGPRANTRLACELIK